MKEFRLKVAVITGAASGIGKALAEKCCAEGMNVVLADVEEQALAATELELQDKGYDVLAVKTDVSSYDDTESLLKKTLDRFGEVHLLFNNAGVAPGGAAWEVTLNDWEWILGVNLQGIIHGIKSFVPAMIDQKTECHIINTASIAGLVAGGSDDALYRTTKHAVVSLTEALYSDLQIRNLNIGVSVVCPGEVRSNLWDHERNRPPVLQNPEKALPGEKTRPNEMSPEQCADLIFDGIRDNRFYILTHPWYNEYIVQRVNNIVEGRNPPI